MRCGVILWRSSCPGFQCYTVQYQALRARSGNDRDAILYITSQCTIKMILKQLYFKIKWLHNVCALISLSPSSFLLLYVWFWFIMYSSHRAHFLFFLDLKHSFSLTNPVSVPISFAPAIVSNETTCMCCNDYVTTLRKRSRLLWGCDCVYMDNAWNLTPWISAVQALHVD